MSSEREGSGFERAGGEGRVLVMEIREEGDCIVGGMGFEVVVVSLVVV